jgi:hypothetical protein
MEHSWLVPTIAALASAIVSVRNGKKADQIHVLVNSRLTEVLADLAQAKDKIGKLERLVVRQDKELDGGGTP